MLLSGEGFTAIGTVDGHLDYGEGLSSREIVGSVVLERQVKGFSFALRLSLHIPGPDWAPVAEEAKSRISGAGRTRTQESHQDGTRCES